jgi:Methyltransferase domain
MKRSIEDALTEAARRIRSDDFVRAILSGSRRGSKPAFIRLDLRPVEIKGQVMIQSIAHDGKKDFTTNHELSSSQIDEFLASGFANLIVDSTTESFQIQITKKEEAITGIGKTKLERAISHDREKERLLPESHPIFQALEFSDASGRIKPSKRDKYIQIDQLLRSVREVLAKREKGSLIKVIDLASGSAALTLAVHAYLSEQFAVTTEGIERNPDLVKKAREIAERAGLSGITFTESEIAKVTSESADLVLALHACDTATDDAIDFVIHSRARATLIVPCCHQTRSEEVNGIAHRSPFFGEDGIIDERLLDLATDALRGERLRNAGYAVDIVEFVGDEHTARNLLVRATLSREFGSQVQHR